MVWGPLQSECVERLRLLGATFLAGNCERDVLRPTDDRDRWCTEQLDDGMRAFVAGWPGVVEREIDGLGRVVFCHATPRDDNEIVTASTPDDAVIEALGAVDADVVVAGHTHVQLDRAVAGAPRFVNAGSVGLPYEGATGAFWTLVGPEIQLRRTSYDVEEAVRELERAGFPTFEEVFPESLRGLVSAESATAHFESRRRGT